MLDQSQDNSFATDSDYEAEEIIPDAGRRTQSVDDILEQLDRDPKAKNRDKIKRAEKLTNSAATKALEGFAAKKVTILDKDLAILIAGLERSGVPESQKVEFLNTVRVRFPLLPRKFLTDMRRAVKHILRTPAAKGAADKFKNYVGEDHHNDLVAYGVEGMQTVHGGPSGTIFRFGSDLVEVVQVAETSTTSIRVLDLDTFTARVNATLPWRKRSQNPSDSRVRLVNVPLEVVKGIYADPLPRIRYLNGIVRSPVFTADGDLIDVPGFHAPSGLFYAPPKGFKVDVPKEVTAADVAQARHDLLDLFGDFPFGNATGEGITRQELVLAADIKPGAKVTTYQPPASFLSCIGWMLEQPCRQIIGDNPLMFLLGSKSVPGAGGGLAVKVMQTITEGRSHSRQLPGSEEEIRKAITTGLRPSPGSMFFDNLPSGKEVRSSALASVTTENVWIDRELGASRELVLPIRCSWVGVGNRPLVSDEIRRRTSLFEIIPNEANPETRIGFDHPNLIDYVTKNRTKYLRAILILVKNWLQAKRPVPTVSTVPGSYERYHAVIVGVLEAAGWTTWGSNRARLSQIASDDEEDEMESLVTLWLNKYGLNTPTESIELCEAAEAAKLELPIKRQLQDGSLTYATKGMGRYIAGFVDRVFDIEGVGSVKVERCTKRGNGGFPWKLSKVKKVDPPKKVEPANSTTKPVETKAPPSPFPGLGEAA